jgi:glycosyltransferase involved in cell wall biosynthesis
VCRREGAALKILLEMRPALLGHAGIPQETRLLFRALRRIEGVEVQGLIQSGDRVLARGLPSDVDRIRRMSVDARINRLSRVVISLQRGRKPRLVVKLLEAMNLLAAPTAMMLRHFLGMSVKLGRFDAEHFRDFIWRALFANTLPFEDFDTVTRADFRVARVPWEAVHLFALLLLVTGRARYPRIDTRGIDLMIAETPYPGVVAKGTRLLVRYHDAIPLLMPHTISDRFFHQAFHYHALRRNVDSGAWFACVSESTRNDLLSVFPQAEPRTVTLHNMVSHHYFPEDSSAMRIAEIIETRRNTEVKPGANQRPTSHMSEYSGAFDYLLIVSTIEPRKNHLTLLAAWEQLRAERYAHLKLVVVGSLGWDHKSIVRKFHPWLGRGHLYMLANVPAPELRLLYRHAKATVCPSFGEGFDFSGVEAMRCGGVVCASDIPVHREVYADAARYFAPYSSGEMASVISQLIDPTEVACREQLVAKGAEISARYLPENVLPKWERFLNSIGTSAAPRGD